MMKRTLFFWLDKLKISRTERRAISYLLITLVVLLVVNSIVRPAPSFDEDHYAELDAQFKRRAALMNSRDQKIKARYQVASSKNDTLPNPDSSSVSKNSGPLIDINTADEATLRKLNGIGASYARRIVAYREANGAFTSKDQLLEVKGIGPARLEDIRSAITMGDSVAAQKVDRPLPLGARMQEKEEVATSSEQLVIDINKADAKMLQQLHGIGSTYARRIIEYRQQNGLFTSKEELLNIKGIGKKRLANIKPFIKLTGQ